jgi:REP element-mobilizing transposase RayT
MGNKKRIWYQGAVYHITTRGNRRTDIFRDEEDYQVYLTILKEAQERYLYILYSYCLMTNHVHLQLETTDLPIWHIMRNINLYYTKYFNNKYNLIGHLFEGRYKSELIENDAYNLQTSRYIHLNPVKAAMVKMPSEYKWSSYGVYMGELKSDIVQEEKILSYFANNSRELYKDYVESKLEKQGTDNEIEEAMGVE